MRLQTVVATSVILSCLFNGLKADDTATDEVSDYELMKLFVDTFQQIETNYVREVDRRQLTEAAIRGMLQELDRYSAFIPPQSVRRFTQMVEQEFGGIGITVNSRRNQLVVVSPLPGTPAYRAGIRAGDAIIEVNGESTEGVTLNEAVRLLQGPVGRPVKLKVVHPTESDPVEMEIIRQIIKAPTVRGERYTADGEWDFMLQQEPRIGYVRMTNFSRYTPDEIRAAIDQLVAQDVEGVVLDLRFNPGGLLEAAIEIADMFLDEGGIVSVRGRNVPERSWDAKKKNTYRKFPLTVLVNSYSASASEVLSACLQDNDRATIVGERTWGKGSVQNVIRMEDGESALKLTTASYHRPSGINIHRFPRMKASEQWGVTPDDGFVIPYSVSEWREWNRDRDQRDVLRSPNEDSAVDDEERFEDRQLLAAIQQLQKELGEGQ